VKAVLNLVLLTVVLLLYYISIGSPAFTPEHQFRKEEKAYLVGPAKILDNISLEKYTGYHTCNRLILATSDEGVSLFQCKEVDLEINKLVYRKKQGDVTVLSLYPIGLRNYEFATYSSLEIPIFVFDSFPNAVRAEMEIELSASYGNQENFQKVYALSAKREVKGYFLFTLSASTANRFEQLGAEGEAFYFLTALSDDRPVNSYVDRAIPVTVRFYDQNDNMIAERHVEIRSPAGEAHAQK
jgi:hypothetical protein